MQKLKMRDLTLCALFAALTGVLSQIAVPIGPVPINLATFAVFCAGALLGSKLGALSLCVWVVLGAAGAPVFSLMRGGLHMLSGPTGGYIIGYIPAAYFTGLLVEKLSRGNALFFYPIAMLAGFFTYFTAGTAWFIALTGTEIPEALMICVVPFIPGDLIKIAAASLVAKRLRLVLLPRTVET